MKIKLLTALLATTISTTTMAVEFNQVQLDKSSVEFSFEQMGVKMNGKFKKFKSQFSFDPSKIEKSKATFDIDLTSVDIGSQEINTEVRGKQWFNTLGFPNAKFVTTNIKSNGANKYEVLGDLSIKGHKKSITIPVVFTQNDKVGVFSGSFTIKRGDFNIGEGDWSKFDLVANEVQVKVNILATTK